MHADLPAGPGTLFGLVSILGITPLLGFGLRLLPLQPVELVVGLVVVAVVPTSLGVGIALAAMGKVGRIGGRLDGWWLSGQVRALGWARREAPNCMLRPAGRLILRQPST